MSMNINDPYMSYYFRQHQTGRGGGVTNVFRGAAYQRGHGGIGTFLSGMFRTIAPLFKSGVKAIGEEAMKSGVGLLHDITTRGSAGDAKSIAGDRFKEFTGSLKRRADEKLHRVLTGGGGGKRARISRKRATRQRATRTRAVRRATLGSRGGHRRKNKSTIKKCTKTKKKNSNSVTRQRRHRRVTPQSLMRLLRRRKSVKKQQQQQRRKKTIRRGATTTTVRDIFG